MYQQRYALAKFGIESKDTKTSSGKGCEYYVKYFFMYASLIQLLIIIALVLFMIYDNAPRIAKERQDRLEQENHGLIFQVKNLSSENAVLNWSLNKSLTEQNKRMARLIENKVVLDKTNQSFNACKVENALLKQRVYTLATAFEKTRECVTAIKLKDHQCEGEKSTLIREREKIRLELNILSESKNRSDIELNKKVQTAETDRESCYLSLISARQEKEAVKRQNEVCENKCNSMLETITQQTMKMVDNFDKAVKEALTVNILFGTDPELKKQMDHIKANCTPISNDLRQQINSVLVKMKTEIQDTVTNNARLTTENSNLQVKIQECEKNRTATVNEMNRKMSDFELTKDREVQKQLQEKVQLRKEKDELNKKVEENIKQISLLSQTLHAVNTSYIICTKGKTSFTRPNISPGNDWIASIVELAQQVQDGQKVPGKF